VGRARSESARLNGKTRASGISSFFPFFHPLPFSSFLLVPIPPFFRLFLRRVEYDVGEPRDRRYRVMVMC